MTVAKRLLVIISILMLNSATFGDILENIDNERSKANEFRAQLHTSISSLTKNAESSRQKMLDLEDRINLLLQEDARRDAAKLDFERVNSILNDLETITCDAESKILELDGFFFDSDIITSGYTTGECLGFAIAARIGYEWLTISIQPCFPKAIEVREKIAALELYLE